MEFYKNLKQKAGDYISLLKESRKKDKHDLIKQVDVLTGRIKELETLVTFKQQKIKTRGQDIRKLKKELLEAKQGMIPEELLKATLKGIPIPLLYTQEDFVIVGHSYGCREYFGRGLSETRYSSLFTNAKQFNKYSERVRELDIAKTLEMGVDLRNKGNVYSKTTALYLRKNADKGYMIYLEPSSPEMKEEEKIKVRDKVKSIVSSLIDWAKPKTKPATEN